jgi:ASCH domain
VKSEEGRNMITPRHVPKSLRGLPALSVRQPWASLIVRGIKDLENRTWTTRYRGRLLIHASGTIDEEFGAADFAKYAKRLGEVARIDDLPRGGVVGVVRLVECVDVSRSRWHEGPVGWVFKDARPVPFIACRGALAVFYPFGRRRGS